MKCSLHTKPGRPAGLLIYIPALFLLCLPGCKGYPKAQDAAGYTLPEPLCDMSYTRIEVPPEQNAYTLWTNALLQLKQPTNKCDRALLRDLGCFRKTLPPHDKLPRLRRMIDEHSDALDLFARGTARGKFQLPVSEFMLLPNSIFSPSKWVRAKIRLLVKDNKHDRAVDEALGLAASGKLIAECSSSTMMYFIGTAIRGTGLYALSRIACDKKVPEQTVQRILDEYPTLKLDKQSFISALIAEYNLIFCPMMERLAENPPHPKIMLDKKYFDLEETKALEAYFISRSIMNTKCRITERDNEIETDIKALAAMPNNDFNFVMDLLTEKTLSRKFKRRLKRTVVGQHNIVGRGLICEGYTNINHDREKVAYELHLCVTALRLYEIRHGELPHKLQDLVTDGILSSIPQDPYAEKPLRYDKQRKVIWSLFCNGVDDGGIPGIKGRDLVISLTNDPPES